MKKLQIVLITFTVAAFVSCSKTEDDFTEDTAVLKTDQSPSDALRKFRGTISGWMQDDLANTCADHYKSKDFEGGGLIDPSGQSLMTIDYCAFTEFNQDILPPYYGTIENGSMVITDKYGDKIFATFNGKFEINRLGKKWVNTITTKKNTIVGGTGRYMYAQGSFDARGRQDLGSGNEPGTGGRAVFTIEGTISFHHILPVSDQSNPDSSGQ